VKSKFIWTIFICFTVAIMVLVSCSTTTSTSLPSTTSTNAPPTSQPTNVTNQPSTTNPTTTSSVVTTSVTTTATPVTTQGKWWDKFGKPQYGGTITYRLATFSPIFDNYSFVGGSTQYWFEKLWANDWTLDRNTWSFSANFTPEQYGTGLLAESWEKPDMQTVIVHLRKNVHWQNKSPVNGREFTAYDVEYHYDRIMGTGHGFTSPAPLYLGYVGNIEKVSAQDNYTVIFKFKKPSAFSFLSIFDPFGLNTFEAQESVEAENGQLKDWHKSVGTGPWMVADYVSNNSITFTKNTDYWGHDERYPENKVPYADELKILVIPDLATSMAALRTGKIDVLDSLPWDQAANLAKTNPELQQAALITPGSSIGLRCDKVPFKDIRVRQALQMAIDLPAIAKSYYGNMFDSAPCGVMSPVFKGYAFAYTDWPQNLKDEYSYNTAKAKELLAEAGYPQGFTTNVYASTGNADMNVLILLKSYFNEIGVTMNINALDWGVWRSYVSAGKHDQMFTATCGSTFPPNNSLWGFYSKNKTSNYFYNNDPAYDNLLTQIDGAASQSDAIRFISEADKYTIEQHWSINLFPINTYNVFQPYFKGYSGESAGTTASWGQAHMWARLWIDANAKKTLGR
jgi:peptide/nickel transport system substrate-binding protein